MCLGQAPPTPDGAGSQPVDKLVDPAATTGRAGGHATKAAPVDQTRPEPLDGPEDGPEHPDLHEAWRSVVEDLEPHQRAWLRASDPVTLHESTAIVAVPDEFTRTQLEGRLRGQ